MPDVRRFFDRDFVGSYDLTGPSVVTIAKVEGGEVFTPGKNKKKKAPILSFSGRTKRMVLNITNTKIIAGLYGFDTAAWIGKRITIFPTKTNFGNDVVDCIRVSPEAPAAKLADAVEKPEPVTVAAELTRRPEGGAA